MSGDKLTPLQRRIVKVLADIRPRWTLTAGGALAGFHLGHRETRDLDDLEADVLRTSPAFSEVRVSDGPAACILDLVAEHAGFSPLTLAWALNGYDVGPAARALGWNPAQRQELASFARRMVDRLAAGAAPE